MPRVTKASQPSNSTCSKLGAMLIFLVGYAGCGKSSLGKRLARRLGKQYVDTDKLVEREVGATVADIFYYEGEEYFRSAERATLERLVDEGFDGVVATGGGLAVWGDNMEQMRGLGVTVYLRRSPKNIISRLSPYGRQKRPKIRGMNDEQLLEFMTAHMAEREPIYSQADVVLDCDKMADNEVIDTILQKIINLKR